MIWMCTNITTRIEQFIQQQHLTPRGQQHNASKNKLPKLCKKQRYNLHNTMHTTSTSSTAHHAHNLESERKMYGRSILFCATWWCLDMKFICVVFLLIDINECDSSNKCSPSNSKCQNTEGSYRCQCDGGYENASPFVCVGTSVTCLPAQLSSVSSDLGRALLGLSGIGIVGISQTIVRSRATLIPEWL